MNTEATRQQLSEIEAAIAYQEGQRGKVPDAIIEATLTGLRAAAQGLRAQLAGSGALAQGEGATAVAPRGVNNQGGQLSGPVLTGDNNHLNYFVQLYQGQLAEDQIRRGIADYVGWVMNHYGRFALRGLQDSEHVLPDPYLPNIYVSLAAQQQQPHERHHRQEEPPRPLDMAQLLTQGNRLVITGAPGAGKTTFLRHIAYLLAYAIYSGDETPVRQQLNLTGAIPLPIYLSLADYHRYKQKEENGTLAQFIGRTLQKQHSLTSLPGDFFAHMLAAQQTICLLFDSLDEIASEEDRVAVTRDILNIGDNDHSIRQIVVASRDHAYVGKVILPARFRRFIVQPMSTEQVNRLVALWCAEAYRNYGQSTITAKTHDLQIAIAELEALRKAQGDERLVDTPLLVMIVAIVHYNNRKLPRQRAALYEKCVNALLAEEHKGEEGEGESQPVLARYGGSVDAKRGHLAVLAYEMMRNHRERQEEDDTKAGRTISHKQLTAWLLPRFERFAGAEEGAKKLGAFCQAMCNRDSLLHERNQEYEFTHLTFQEFLCAYHLHNWSAAEIADFWQAEERLLQSWWRETILLTIGYLWIRAMDKGLALLEALLAPQATYALSVAAVELATAGLLELEEPPLPQRQQAQARLVSLLSDPDGNAPPSLRALAGTALGRLGDRRKGVCTLEPDWVQVTGSEFPMGQGRHPVSVQSFAIAHYPVTNAQFQWFMEAGGYGQQRYWTAEGWAYRQHQNLTEPWLWDDARYNQPNQPVVGVSWYEAVAYANWLTETLRQQGKLDEKWVVRLPTEAEWELAGAGLAGRQTPWAGAWNMERANTKEGGVGQPTAVGVFPAGATPEGVHDLLGNVWEWCSTRWRDEKGQEYPLPYRADDGRERMDGGDEVVRVLKGWSYYDEGKGLRLAARLWLYPSGRNVSYGFRVAASPSTSDL